MELSCTEVRSKSKRPLRVVGWCLRQKLRRRSQKSRQFREQRDEARRELAQREAELARLHEQLCELQNRVRKLECENRRLAAAPCRLPDDPPLESHKYGAKMICLATNSARAVGLRPTLHALKIFWEWRGIEQPIPNWTTIRTWLMRLLEGQHSKGGFTSLLASFAALLKPADKESVRRSFSKVSVKRVREWTKTNLGTTLASKRQALYTEFRSATEIITAT